MQTKLKLNIFKMHHDNLTEKDFRIIDVNEYTLQIETEIFKWL